MSWIIKTFSELTTDELYKILQLRNEVFIVEQECPYQDIDGKDNKSYHIFLEKDNEVIAYSRILKKGISYEQASIGRVIVKKDYRGRNIARDMLLKSISFIENSLHEKEIKIQAQAYLDKFYSSLGFKKISDVYLEDNIPHMDMLYKK
ncbi:GNAT family N-acetyltransferase [Clostridium sp. CCUG 7971]|uniref:GNAT family N-acetyltransferase n=1 Tax=Clostridium sp. CCUG 7971 TaxID=2811414 RepID=UPI001ABABE31|nr:GNAT family N-acetyltransferase [Clostridium sp. CCUG 7971]MBO3446395.1 GNAT family N-acetyltransferase [Clostridium sp. CCUG 7971]